VDTGGPDRLSQPIDPGGFCAGCHNSTQSNHHPLLATNLSQTNASGQTPKPKRASSIVTQSELLSTKICYNIYPVDFSKRTYRSINRDMASGEHIKPP